MEESNFHGLALVCTPEGAIAQVISSSILPERPALGSSFISLLNESSVQKGLSFLRSVRNTEIAADWELNIRLPGTAESGPADADPADESTVLGLHFVGASVPPNILIVGSPSDSEADEFLNRFISMNNEQVNTIRAVLKEQNRAEQAYDELSAMNNEMADLQRRLLKSNHELEEMNRLKNHMVGMAAHDLRGPLGSFVGLTEFLLQSPPDTVADSGYILAELHRHAQSMLAMVNDLLDVAKIESGDLDLHMDTVDLVELIKHALLLNRLGAERKNITIECVYEKPSIALTADPGKIEQVLTNLLSNAVKYSPPGSEVSVSAHRSEEAVLVSVEDHGPGISAEGQARLFQPFGRVGSKPTAGEQSTGLGLAICRKIIEGHKGSIWVESSTGRGSTFFFSLPLKV